MKKKPPPLVTWAFAALVLGCAHPAPLPFTASPVLSYADQMEQTEDYQVLEYQHGSAPPWFTAYTHGGLEAVDDEGTYAFVGKNRGANFRALQQWAEAFTVEQDLPRLVARRVEAALLRAAPTSPDDYYGRYFETLIKAASDTAYPGAVKEETFWLLKDMGGRRLYEFYVLVRVDRRLLQEELTLLLRDTASSNMLRDQAAAAAKLRSSFFNFF